MGPGGEGRGGGTLLVTTEIEGGEAIVADGEFFGS